MQNRYIISVAVSWGLLFGTTGNVFAANSPPLNWHEPLGGALPVIRAEFQSSIGIREVLIRITVGALTCCEATSFARLVSIPSRRDEKEFVAKCQFNKIVHAGQVATCRFEVKKLKLQEIYGASPLLISYQASADDGGTLRSGQEVTFALGKPLCHDCFWPIWWHRATGFEKKVDLVLLPDKDYGDEVGSYDTFTADAADILAGAFFAAKPATKIFVRSRHEFNLWLGPPGSDAEDCWRTFPPKVLSMLQGFDGNVVLHQKFFNDCAEIKEGGSGSTYAGRPSILVHESGHFLFGLADEYDCGGTYEPLDKCKNVWNSELECKEGAAKGGFDKLHCKEICCSSMSNGWCLRPNGGEQSIMAEAILKSTWLQVGENCVQTRFEQCALSCY